MKSGVLDRLDNAYRDAEEAYRKGNLESQAQYELACRGLPGGNVRSHMYFSPFPLTLARGEAAYVWDVDGHQYTDFLCEYSAGLFGHSHPKIVAALRKALEDGIAMGGPIEIEGRFAALLCARFPSIERVRFCNSGTEACLFALATARVHTGRNRVLVFEGAYHGSCLRFASGGSPLNVPIPFVVAPYNDIERTVALIEEHSHDLAAVIVEPVLGTAGYIPGRLEFFHALRERCNKHGVVLIFDEVVTSRLAPGGLQSELNVWPDMTTLGKYVGGGVTFGAFGGKAEIMRRFDPRQPDALYHAGTFNNNRLTMVAGYTAMSEVFTSDVVKTFNESGDRLRIRLERLIAKRGVPVQLTGMGSIICLHFTGRSVQSAADLPRNDVVRRLWHFGMLARGQYVMPRGGLILSLPMTEQDVDNLVSAIGDFFDTYASVLPGS